MSEAEDLLAVYGAIDIAVGDDAGGESVARVAALLPLYEEYPELQWYEEFLEWRSDEGAELPDSVGTTLKSAGLALQHLANREPGSNRLAARRLLGLYALTQARADLFGPRGELGEEVHGALAAVLRPGMTEELGEDGEGRANQAARRIHAFMAEDVLSSEGQDADERWSLLTERVSAYINVGALGPRPCTGRLKKRRNVNGVVATLVSQFDVYDVEFDHAVTFLDPAMWPKCMDFWCRMAFIEDVPPDKRRYDELVSTDCPPPGGAVFTLQAILDFKRTIQANAMITSYTLAPVPQPPDGALVDEGSLSVSRMRGGFLRVVTTKGVQLNRAFSGEQLAALGCAMGWTEKGKDMMYNCAWRPDAGVRRTRRRDPLGVSPRRRIRPRVAGGSVPGRARSRRGAGPPRSVIPDIAQQTADAIKDCVDDQSAYLEDWADRVADDDYGYKDMLDDMARASVRMVVDSARILDLATRNARIASAGARARRATQPAHATPPDEEERPSWTTTLG